MTTPLHERLTAFVVDSSRPSSGRTCPASGSPASSPATRSARRPRRPRLHARPRRPPRRVVPRGGAPRRRRRPHEHVLLVPHRRDAAPPPPPPRAGSTTPPSPSCHRPATRPRSSRRWPTAASPATTPPSCSGARSTGERLGLDVRPGGAGDLADRARAMLGSNPGGYLDDSHTGIARYDIYSGDIYLFTEPFADRLGDVWAARRTGGPRPRRPGRRDQRRRLRVGTLERRARPRASPSSSAGWPRRHRLLDDAALGRWVARSATPSTGHPAVVRRRRRRSPPTSTGRRSATAARSAGCR